MLNSHHPELDGGRCLVRCDCLGIRLVTVADMYDHMAEAHPVLFEGLGLSADG